MESSQVHGLVYGIFRQGLDLLGSSLTKGLQAVGDLSTQGICIAATTTQGRSEQEYKMGCEWRDSNPQHVPCLAQEVRLGRLALDGNCGNVDFSGAVSRCGARASTSSTMRGSDGLVCEAAVAITSCVCGVCVG